MGARNPSGGHLFGRLNIGGMDIGEVRNGLNTRLEALEAVPLILKAEGNTELTLTLKQAGMTYEAEHFLRGLKELTEGRLLDRVRARRSFPAAGASVPIWRSANSRTA